MDPDIRDPAAGWTGLLSGANATRSFVLLGGVAMHAAYVFVVATTLPAIVADIGGIAQYAWVTTVFVVGSVGGSAIAASLAGRLGLRAAYRLATALFVAGGGTCAMAPGMSGLLTGRALQGLGGGLLTALAYTTIRQLLPDVLRSRAIAMVSGVWGVAALSGPLLGGVFAAPNRWRDAFWLAVPLGLSYIAVTEYVLPKRSQRVEAAPVAVGRLALLGAAALAVSAGSVPGRLWPSTVGILACVVLMAALFALDRRAQIRLLPAGAFSVRTPLGAISLTMALLVVGTGTMPFVRYVSRRLTVDAVEDDLDLHAPPAMRTSTHWPDRAARALLPEARASAARRPPHSTGARRVERLLSAFTVQSRKSLGITMISMVTPAGFEPAISALKGSARR